MKNVLICKKAASTILLKTLHQFQTTGGHGARPVAQLIGMQNLKCIDNREIKTFEVFIFLEITQEAASPLHLWL